MDKKQSFLARTAPQPQSPQKPQRNTYSSSSASQPTESMLAFRQEAATYVDSRFNLEKTKARVFKLFEDTAPARFKTFYKGDLFGKFLSVCIDYFCILFHEKALYRKAREQSALDPRSPKKPSGKHPGSAGDAECPCVLAEKVLEELGPIYSLIIMTESDYAHTQQDKLFFESFYEAVNQIMQDAFVGQRRAQEVEIELGRIFRTNRFNISKRKNSNQKKGDSLSSRELYSLRHEGDHRLNARLLEQLFPPKENLCVKAASSSCSPIVSKLVGQKQSETPSKGAHLPTGRLNKDGHTMGMGTSKGAAGAGGGFGSSEPADENESDSAEDEDGGESVASFKSKCSIRN
eukprot:jgi/Mesvir1/7054/Mv09170-RA.1